MTEPARQPVYFTFGNHMHWVDMQWLWGDQVLPDSVRDMLALIEATGARGNVNFDGIGYEKMAAEAPEALAELRAAVAAGAVEVVGATYGQPYGLFQGGESNVRQRIYGARAVRRLLGVWPQTFWEEEFDFFPQLPQMLAQCGFTGASLFFQWTWHTPTVPEERVPIVRWEGIDGTRLPAVAKTELCLHQWPEDFDGRLESDLMRELPRPAIVQWLELMPSPDWMCRSEVLLPRLRALFADPRFEVRAVTLGGLIAALDGADAPVRAYTMDDVFHGMSLGKNGDRVPRASLRCEDVLLAAESTAALAGLFGRPYASWSVYPTWELEEGWRQLLAAQHHDNHECEGLCGAIGAEGFHAAQSLGERVLQRSQARLSGDDAGREVLCNPLGWMRDGVPPFGHVQRASGPRGAISRVERDDDEQFVLAGADLRLTIDRRSGKLTQLTAPVFPDGVLEPTAPLLEFVMQVGGDPVRFEGAVVEDDGATVSIVRSAASGELRSEISILDAPARVAIRVQGTRLARPDPGMHAGLRTFLAPDLPGARLLHDTPYAVAEVRAERDHVRKYPTGDWMTSPQVFETIHRPFTASSFVDFDAGDRGLLVAHDGGQAWFREERGISNLLTMYDPWDEDLFVDAFVAQLWLLPHARLRHAERWRLATACRRPLLSCGQGRAGLPATFGGLEVDAANVVATAFYRESRKAAEHVGRRFAPDVRDPFVVRLVEFDGEPADVTLKVPGPCAAAAKTNLLGQVEQALRAVPCAPPTWAPAEPAWSALRLSLRPREIATVLLDLELGRHQPRNLDDHRHIWATVHRRQEN